MFPTSQESLFKNSSANLYPFNLNSLTMLFKPSKYILVLISGIQMASILNLFSPISNSTSTTFVLNFFTELNPCISIQKLSCKILQFCFTAKDSNINTDCDPLSLRTLIFSLFILHENVGKIEYTLTLESRVSLNHVIPLTVFSAVSCFCFPFPSCVVSVLSEM